MTLQTERLPDADISRERPARQTHYVAWLVAVFIATAIAVVAGVAITAQPTRPAPANETFYQEPNANTREGRVSATVYGDPNANTREDRVPTTTVLEPNANTREGRVSGNS